MTFLTYWPFRKCRRRRLWSRGFSWRPAPIAGTGPIRRPGLGRSQTRGGGACRRPPTRDDPSGRFPCRVARSYRHAADATEGGSVLYPRYVHACIHADGKCGCGGDNRHTGNTSYPPRARAVRALNFSGCVSQYA